MIFQALGFSSFRKYEGYVYTPPPSQYTDAVFVVCHQPDHSQAQQILKAHTITGDSWMHSFAALIYDKSLVTLCGGLWQRGRGQGDAPVCLLSGVFKTLPVAGSHDPHYT